MDFRQCKKPVWANPEHTAVNVQVEWKKRRGVIVTYTASADDPEPSGRDLYQRIIDGEFGTIAEAE